ncbi:MAG TPA: hypothetical protein VGJ70_25430 [Solirubrobacteraceae bacterium]
MSGAFRGDSQLGALTILVMAWLVVGALLLLSSRRSVEHAPIRDAALDVAEAGIGEAMQRIRAGDVPDGPNPRMVAQILLCGTTDLPALGSDTTALATAQPPEAWLPYSTAAPGAEALTVRFKTDPRQRIYRYDAARDPAVQTASGVPIFVVTATGQAADARRTVVAEVARDRVSLVDTNVWAALVAGGDIRLDAESHECGFNHRGDTPAWTGVGGRTAEPGGCDEDLEHGRWEIGSPAHDRYALWAGGRVEGASEGHHGGPRATAQEQGHAYAGCWEALGMSRSDYESMVGPPVPSALGRRLRGIVHVTGPVTARHCEGEGLLVVEGDLTIRDGFAYRGLVYATGRVVVDGSCWVLGAVVAGRDVVIGSRGGSCAVLYSRDAIERGVDRFGTRLVLLSRREE